jgi:hypothetical protein
MTGAQHARTPLRYRQEFDFWIIKSFVIITLSALLMLFAAGIEEAGRAMNTELSRYEPANDTIVPTDNVPFRENGPAIAIAEGVGP